MSDANTQQIEGVCSAMNSYTVQTIYQALLGREPEDVDLVTETFQTPEELIRSIQTWPEYNERQSRASTSKPHIMGSVQVLADRRELERLWDHVAEQWSQLGETNPWWSVLSAPRFRRERIDSVIVEELYESGSAVASELHTVLASMGKQPRLLIDFGCGVGRLSWNLSKAGFKVCGVDISAGNLEEAAVRMSEVGSGFQPVQLKQLDDLWLIPRAEVVVSFITLQHNPPPVQVFILERLCNLLLPGGVLFIQYVASIKNYGFSSQSFLELEMTEMDMHALPTTAFVQTVTASHMSIHSWHSDGWGGPDAESYTVVAVKAAEVN